MTDNEILARWQGNPNFSQITLILQTDTGYWPDYLNDDAAAMSLLDTLVEKGFVWFLGVDTDELGEITDIRCKVRHKDSTASINKYTNTRREAVVAAVLELIGKEGV